MSLSINDEVLISSLSIIEVLSEDANPFFKPGVLTDQQSPKSCHFSAPDENTPPQCTRRRDMLSECDSPSQRTPFAKHRKQRLPLTKLHEKAIDHCMSKDENHNLTSSKAHYSKSTKQTKWRAALVVGPSQKKYGGIEMFVVRTEGGGVYRVNAAMVSESKLTKPVSRGTF